MTLAHYGRATQVAFDYNRIPGAHRLLIRQLREAPETLDPAAKLLAEQLRDGYAARFPNLVLPAGAA